LGMESHSATALPLRVCPRCAAASRTDSETCPNCGRRYRRRYWIGAVAVAVAVLAFGVGFGAREFLNGDDSGSDTISDPQANSVALGISREQLNQRLGGAAAISAEPVAKGGTCLAYPSSDTPDRTWVFCLRDDRLFEKRQIETP
jgi:hypothetical protein